MFTLDACMNKMLFLQHKAFALRFSASVINLMRQISAWQHGVLAIYLCLQPTSQLYVLVPDGSKRQPRAQIDREDLGEVRLQAMPGNMLGRVKRRAGPREPN